METNVTNLIKNGVVPPEILTSLSEARCVAGSGSDIDWKLYEEAYASGKVSGKLYKSVDGNVYYIH